ncbi:hypothetical protein QU831_12710 [Escherichia coli]|nr:hypothetical protein [Escherichia coli]WKB06285.1 hypothetical protein QU831_12710 [Escherichia coli]
MELRDNTLILSDNGGRSLYFEHLFPGEDGYSRSESLWLVRGSVAKLDEGHRLAALWQALPEELRLSPHRYLATNSPQGPWCADYVQLSLQAGFIQRPAIRHPYHHVKG